MFELDEILEEPCATPERVSTALASYCANLPAVRMVPDADPELRQMVAFGARLLAAEALQLDNAAWFCIETSRRRVHAFRCDGGGMVLPLAAVSSLAALADAASLPYGPACAALELVFERRGWRVVQIVEELQDLSILFEESGAPAGGSKLIGADCQLFASEPEEPADALLRAFLGQYPGFDEAATRNAAWRQLSGRARLHLDAFLSNLQPMAVEACRRLHCRSLKAFNALTHDRQRLALYRSQLAAAVPVLAKVLAESTEACLLPLRLAVDMRLELAGAGASAFGVKRELIRFLSGVEVEEIGLDDPEVEALWLNEPQYVLGALAAVEPAHRPSGLEEWAAFHELVRPLRQWQDHFPALIAPFLCYAGRRGFVATRDTVLRRLGHLELLVAFGEYLDCLEKGMRRSRRVASAEEGQRFRRDYAARRGLLRLALEAHRWRGRVARETTRRIAALEQATRRPELAWPFAMPQEVHGLSIVFLASGAAMVAESLRMSHCIETLYPEAVRGERLPFSVRNSAGEAVATFDLSLRQHPAGWRVELNALSGPRNGEPTPAVAGAVASFIKSASEAASGNEAAIERWLTGCKGRKVQLLERDRERFVRAAEREAIRPILQRLTTRGRRGSK